MTPASRHPRTARALGLTFLVLLTCLGFTVATERTQGIDLLIRNGVHLHASPLLTDLAQWVTELGSVLFLTGASALALIAFLLARLRAEAIRLACVMVGGLCLENGLKYGFHRARPEAFFGVDPTTYSFPSGHSLLSFCFYFTLASIVQRRARSAVARAAIWIGALSLIAAIGMSRIYLGVHYPTDVLGGFLTACLWIALLVRLEALLAARARA